jgi:2-oxoglutarate dehydrogenase E2 component (dihydrolipoamide succinyltransferase)
VPQPEPAPVAATAAPAPAPAEAPAPAAPPSAPAPAPAAQAAELAPGEELTPMTAMRRGVMEHMRRSVDTAAHVTSAIEVDMARVVALRAKLKPELATQKVNLTYLAFIARAAVDTLLDYPWINGEIRGQSIVTRPHVNLGIAVALEEGKGLIVPVIRNVQDLNLTGVARSIQDLAERARTKKLLPDDVQGGTFTITNPGSFGTFHGTPIINQPQSAILGTYALVKRPWVIQDELGGDVIAIRPLMNLTLTYDHRLVDGAYAGMFLRDLRDRLESWDEAAY